MRYPRLEWAVWIVAAAFVFAGCYGIGRLGVQTDEALFAGGIYPPFSEHRLLQLGEWRMPIMVFDYIGALKSALWAPVLTLFGPSAASVRVPAVLLAALALLLYAAVLRDIAGRGASILFALLLATDATYLFTARYDFGPVALQQLLKAIALWAALRFHRNPRRRWVFLLGLALGLGLWDKTVFTWQLAGLAGAVLLLYGTALRIRLTPARGAIFLAAFLLGSAPFLVFNLRNHWASFQGRGLDLDSMQILGKLPRLWATLEGTGMLGLFAPAGPGPGSLLPVLAAAAVLGAFFAAGRRRQALFFLAAFVFTWLAMAATKEGGESMHHVVLVYPYPHLLIALLAARLMEWKKTAGWIAVAAVAITAATGARVIERYHAAEMASGGTPAWSSAFYEFNASLNSERPRTVATLDWGFYDNTRLFQQGAVDLWTPGTLESEDELNEAKDRLRENGLLFVRHLPGSELLEGHAGRFIASVQRLGYVPANHRTFRDRYGHPVIQTFRLARLWDGLR